MQSVCAVSFTTNRSSFIKATAVNLRRFLHELFRKCYEHLEGEAYLSNTLKVHSYLLEDIRQGNYIWENNRYFYNYQINQNILWAKCV
jgi:hypothetical protein